MLNSNSSKIVAQARSLQQQAAMLLLYQSVLSGEIGQAFLELLGTLHYEGNSCLPAYGRWFKALAASGQSWQDYLLGEILTNINPFSQQAQILPLEQLPSALTAAAAQDLQALRNFYLCSAEEVCQWVQATADLKAPPVAWNLPATHAADIFGSNGWKVLADRYRRYGTGIFASDRAFRWLNGELIPVKSPDPIRLENLAGYATQKAALLQNTEFLLAGYPALNVLLYGSRGTGKSSLVKGLLNHYANSQLRLIEVAKSDLKDLPAIAEKLRNVPQKFIIFVDDLSFEEDDEAFKALKVVLEGNITAKPANAVVYATSNRRHLVREFFADRPRPKDADEVQAWDTVQEKLSFSDRFGLTLTFEPADQTTYLNIVRHLAAQVQIPLTPEDLEYRALQWATRHNGRSGRGARQFIDFITAELGISERFSGENATRSPQT